MTCQLKDLFNSLLTKRFCSDCNIFTTKTRQRMQITGFQGHAIQNTGSTREGQWNTNIPEKKSTKYPKIPQIPPNIPKNNRSFEYFIPEIRSQRNKHLFGCLTFFGIPLNGWSLLSHDNRSQEKANVKLCIHVRNTVRSPRIISSAVIKATRSTPSCTSLLCILLFLF